MLKVRLVPSSLVAIVFTVGLAANLRAATVQNAGFETGDFTGWTTFGDQTFTGVTSSVCPGLFAVVTCTPESGAFAAYFGPTPSGGVSQTITTIVNGTYDLDFWLNTRGDTGSGGTPNEYTVSWDGNVIVDVVDAPAAPWTHYTINGLVATGTSTQLSFSFTDAPNWFGLDDVGVTDAAATPEPASLGLAGAALLALAAVRRRK
jgi:MYXO-CTERM domain-containing protein